MKGEGYYDQYSSAQGASIRGLLGWITEAVEGAALPEGPAPVTAVDFGCAEGRNSLAAFGAFIEAVRRHRPEQAVGAVFSDLPTNNFNQLFANLNDPRLPAVFRREVYPSAVAGSFYTPLLPPGSVHFAMSFNSLLWLDQVPAVPIPDFIGYMSPHPPRPEAAVPPEAAAAFARQAESDLLRFLECRAQELAAGGKLLIAMPGGDGWRQCSDGLYDLLNDACADLVEAGRVERGRYERLVMPVYFRTLGELLAPVERAGSPVHGRFSVERAETLEVATPFVVAYRATGDLATYADEYTGFLRAFSEPVVRAGLAGDASATDAVYERVRARLRADPARYEFPYIQVAALLTRR
jgi:hypothetical protein